MIAAIENAVLAAIRNASEADALGYRFVTVESSPYDWDYLFTDSIASVRMPAIWTGFTGWRDVEMEDGGNVHVIGATFALLVGMDNLRNEKATRHGDGGRPGSYQLLTDCISLLLGERLDLDIMPLKFGPAREVSRTAAMRTQRISIFAAEYATDFWIDRSGTGLDAGNAGSFEHFHADWDVPAFSGVGPDLPDPDDADASDDVTLEGDPD